MHSEGELFEIFVDESASVHEVNYNLITFESPVTFFLRFRCCGW